MARRREVVEVPVGAVREHLAGRFERSLATFGERRECEDGGYFLNPARAQLEALEGGEAVTVYARTIPPEMRPGFGPDGRVRVAPDGSLSVVA